MVSDEYIVEYIQYGNSDINTSQGATDFMDLVFDKIKELKTKDSKSLNDIFTWNNGTLHYTGEQNKSVSLPLDKNLWGNLTFFKRHVWMMYWMHSVCKFITTCIKGEQPTNIDIGNLMQLLNNETKLTEKIDKVVLIPKIKDYVKNFIDENEVNTVVEFFSRRDINIPLYATDFIIPILGNMMVLRKQNNENIVENLDTHLDLIVAWA